MLVRAILLLTLLVVAAPARAETSLEAGEARLPADARVTGTPLLALATGVDVGRLLIEASELRLAVYRTEAVALNGAIVGRFYPNPVNETKHELHNVTIDARGSPEDDGFAVLRSRTGLATANPSQPGGLLLAAPRSSHNTMGGGTEAASDKRPYYQQEIEVPHVLYAGSGSLDHEGDAWMKLVGFDVTVTSDEGVFTFDAMKVEDTVVLHNETRTWIVLSFPQGRVRIEGALPWTLAAAKVDFSSSSVAVVPADKGDSPIPTEPASNLLKGPFEGTAEPVVVGNKAWLRLDLGDTPVPASLGSAASRHSYGLPVPRTSWMAWLAVSALLGGMGLVVGRWGLAPKPSPATVEDCLAAAAVAISQERWSVAAEWLARGRTLAPQSGRLCADLAYAKAQLGSHEEALDLFEEARRLGTEDGESLFHGALAALTVGRPAAEVEAWLVDALARSPTLVVDVEEGLFEPVRGRPGVEEAVDRAWEQVASPDADA